MLNGAYTLNVSRKKEIMWALKESRHRKVNNVERRQMQLSYNCMITPLTKNSDYNQQESRNSYNLKTESVFIRAINLLLTCDFWEDIPFKTFVHFPQGENVLNQLWLSLPSNEQH